MEPYCLKCKKYTENVDPHVSSTINGKRRLLFKCKIYNSKKSRFINKHLAGGLMSNLGVRTLLNKIPLLGDILF